MFVDGCAASAARDDNHIALDEALDRRKLANREWSRATDNAPKVAVSVGFHDVAFRLDLSRSFRRQCAPDELRGISKRGIGGVDFHLRDDGRHTGENSGPFQRILQRLLNHVADPSRRGRHEYAERQGTRLLTSGFVANQLVTLLRPVAVHDAHVPPVEGELDDRTEALTRVSKLIVDRRALARRRQRIAAERDDGHPLLIPRHWTGWTHGARGGPSRRPSSSNARPNAAQSPRRKASRIAAYSAVTEVLRSPATNGVSTLRVTGATDGATARAVSPERRAIRLSAGLFCGR